MESDHLKVMRPSGVRAGQTGSPNITFSFWEQLNEMRPTFRKRRKHISKVWNKSVSGGFTAGDDPDTWWHSWARVKDVKLPANSEQHAEKM